MNITDFELLTTVRSELTWKERQRTYAINPAILVALANRFEQLASAVDNLPRLEWKPIATISKTSRICVLLIAHNPPELERPYTTDPYSGWMNSDGSFARWPHKFPPTHWAKIDTSCIDT